MTNYSILTDNDYSFEDKLTWLGKVDRFRIACGSYGDCQWQIYDEDGHYIEYEDHQKFVKLYEEEIKRLNTIFAKAVIE